MEKVVSKYRLKMLEITRTVYLASQQLQSAYLGAKKQDYNSCKQMLKPVRTLANDLDMDIVKIISVFGPRATNLKQLLSIMKITNELVSISDNLKKYCDKMIECLLNEITFLEYKSFITKLHDGAVFSLDYLVECLSNFDTCDPHEIHRKIMVEENKNDDIFILLEKEVIKNIHTTIEQHTYLIKSLGNFRLIESISDRAANISNLILFSVEDGNTATIY